MKRFWIGYTGASGSVVEVEVVGQRNPEASWGRSVVRLADGTIDDVRTSDLHETEAAARWGRALNEAEDLEDEARNLEESAEHERKAAEWRLSVAAGRDDEARALRARAKGLRDELEGTAPKGNGDKMVRGMMLAGEVLMHCAMTPEVKDATEGRR